MDINTIKDAKKFYIWVNELAFQISSNEILINELSSVIYDDNQKLFKGITHILGYGQAVGRYKDLFTAKEVKLNAFLKKNPRFRNRIGIIQKEATIYFSTLAKRVEDLERRDKEKDKAIEELKRELKDLIKSGIFSPDHIFKVEMVGTTRGLSPNENENVVTEDKWVKVRKIKVSLAGKTIRFDNKSATIIVNEDPCPLDRTSIQSRVAKTMFGRGSVVDKGVHWHDILGVPLSGTVLGREAQNQSIRGAVRGINKKIQKTFNTDDTLFRWDNNGSLIRNF